MTRDPKDNSITVSYPWKECVDRLKDNSKQAFMIQTNIEKRMVKAGILERYNDEIQKAINAGTLRKLSMDEMKEWVGPTNYNTVFPVIKEESVSTKVRVVCNSAQINSVVGLSVNDCMW